MQKPNALFVVDAFLATDLQTTKAACHDDDGHAIRGHLPKTPLGAPFSQYLLACFAVQNLHFGKNAKSCQELPRIKSQRTQTSELQATICCPQNSILRNERFQHYGVGGARAAWRTRITNIERKIEAVAYPKKEITRSAWSAHRWSPALRIATQSE